MSQQSGQSDKARGPRHNPVMSDADTATGTTAAIVVRQTGGPEVMRLEDVPLGRPGPGEVLIRHTAIGVNFIDIYRRSGLYPFPDGLPGVPGCEALGVVEAVGAGVSGFKAGDRVCYPSAHHGAYAAARVIAATKIAAIDDDIPDNVLAGFLVRGLTAEYLVRRLPVLPQKGAPVLVHAAAGGVGVVLCQWLKHLGATVIGTVSTDAKAEVAKNAGADHVVLYSRENFVERVREITGGEGVAIAYDSVGRDTFMGSLDCIRRRGMMVSYGNAAGPPEPIAPRELMVRGSLFLSRPMLDHYVDDPQELRAACAALFAAIRAGIVKLGDRHVYDLKDAARAHADLAARRTTGAVMLRVQLP